MVNISEIWIITETGLPLFNKSVDQKMDMFVLGGFLSAIQTFIKASFQEEKLDRLVMGESKLTFLYAKGTNIFIVVRTHKKEKDKEIRKKLELIKDLFIARYGERLKNFNCDVSDFQHFYLVLEENLKKELVVKRMQNWLSEI